MRKLITLCAVFACTSAMGGITYSVGSGGLDPSESPPAGATQSVVIGGIIPPWSQCIWGQTDDMTIAFDSGPNTDAWQHGDAGGLLPGGQYFLASAGTRQDEDKVSSVDPWAGHTNSGTYYEAIDAADVYVASNKGVIMNLAPSGNLTSANDVIPTWFTLAFSHDVWKPGCTTAYDGYATAVNVWGGTIGTQAAFPMAASGPWNLLPVSQAPVAGTLTFHARMHRNGLNDLAGSYTASIAVNIVEAP